MFTRNLEHCDEFTAGDGTTLRELLHPDKANLDLRYSLAHAVLPPGGKSRLHSLKTSEVYYILEGKGVMNIAGETRQVGQGDAIYIPPKARQCIENVGTTDLKFLCVVDPAWRKQDEDVL